MTTPFDSQAFPTTPTAPSATPAGYTSPTSPDSRTSPPITSEQIEAKRGQFLELILQQVVKAVLGFFNPASGAFEQLQAWASEIPFIGDLINLINRLLSPFGDNDGTFDLPSALNQLVLTFTEPLRQLGSLAELVEDITTLLGGRIGGLEARINALNLSLDPDVAETGGYDDCKTAANFTSLAGFPALDPTGWGALKSNAIAVAHFNSSPTTDRHGAGIRVKAKTIGITRLHIAADAAMTNFVAIEMNVSGSGTDTVSVVTGTSPTGPFATQKSTTMRIPTESFWEIRYEPYSDTSATSNTFHVFMNGDPVLPLRWKDDGNVVIHGPDHLEVGVTLNGLNHPTRRGFAITDFTFYDWLAAAPQ